MSVDPPRLPGLPEVFDEAAFDAVLAANTVEMTLPVGPDGIRLLLLAPEAAWFKAPYQLFSDEGPQPFWAIAWGSGQLVAHYLVAHPEVVRGKRVLDAGCGSGIVGIAAMLAGAAAVTALDIDPRALAATRRNAALNGVAVETTLGDVAELVDGDWDLVIASDVFYLNPHSRDWLKLHTASGRRVWVADPGRGVLETEGLIELDWRGVRSVPEWESVHVRRAFLYEVP